MEISFIAIPLASAFVVAMIANLDERIQDCIACLAALATLTLSLFAITVLSGAGSSGAIVYKVGGWVPPFGVSIVIDGLAAFMLVTVNLIALAALFYSTGYMKKYTDKWKFYALFLLLLAGINGVLVSGDVFNLYIFMEIAAIAAYALVAFGTTAEELEASFKYAVMGTVASCFIFLGIAFLYGYSSTLNMADMASVLASKGPSGALLLASVLFLMGFGLKAALAPFHAWLAYAHSSAPAPVSAMLSGVVIKVLGMYAIARIFFNVFGITPVISFMILTLAVLSMIVGSMLAFVQSDIKRMLAYSTVSQIGYVALGLGVGTPLAIFGALFHLFNHSLFKSLLFLNSGSIERVAGTRDMGKIAGILDKAPLTAYTGLVGALSICGVPPLGGFWSKFIIILACIQAGRPILALTAVVVSILTLAYYFKSYTPVLFGNVTTSKQIKAKSLFTMNAPMVALTVLVALAAFILIPVVGNVFMDGAVASLVRGISYTDVVFEALK
ncbi:MAG: NADH/ubiquinone/plastoquinone (complex I) [Candidatus Omnitrophica bacterium]|nr:NADH/ubiquinone/plastoquinone (complex I) [Candidatus Omnitrophota bacterium]MCM8791155.1 NADH/ubiquinone/plastoquinone (complex I) [Candidatus Omnitrophota bacterium]